MTREENRIEHVRTSWMLQGCLIGGVALFVILLILLLILAYGRFRENTRTEPEEGAIPIVLHRPLHLSIDG